jgi:hypothetical protein
LTILSHLNDSNNRFIALRVNAAFALQFRYGIIVSILEIVLVAIGSIILLEILIDHEGILWSRCVLLKAHGAAIDQLIILDNTLQHSATAIFIAVSHI